MPNKIIDVEEINEILSGVSEDPVEVRNVLQKAGEAQGLSLRDVAVLSSVKSPDLLQELFEKAREVKDAIYGNRLVLFAPLYLSNLCSNECLYCAFRASNKLLKRRALLQDEIKREVTNLVEQGQKRLLLVAGESNTKDEFKYILDSIKTVYSVKIKWRD